MSGADGAAVRIYKTAALLTALTLIVAIAIVGATEKPRLLAGHKLRTEVQPLQASQIPSFETISELDELTSDHATVFRLYWAYFLRHPDASGALYWVERVDRCDSLAFIAQQFADSGEFKRRYGSLSNAAFIKLIYRNVLGRQGESEGVKYWQQKITGAGLSRGDVVLNISLGSEFVRKHPYPSDGVPSRGCRQGVEKPSKLPPKKIVNEKIASAGGVDIQAPANVIKIIGMHQSSHPGAQSLVVNKQLSIPLQVMESRGRGTSLTGAADIAVHPSVSIKAPVTGRVARSGNYTLYCRYQDGYVVINPESNPDLELKILHISDVTVKAGQWVKVGDRIAANATTFPFTSQIDKLTPSPSWPHVHIELVDPSISRDPSSGSC